MSPVVCVPTRQNIGFRTHDLRVEVSVLRGLQNFALTGLPSEGLRDARDKIRAILHNSVSWDPLERLVVNLAPQEISKSGSHLELPIALACWVALQPTLREDPRLLKKLLRYRFYGSLDLSGQISNTPAAETLFREDSEALGAPNFSSLKDLVDWLISSAPVPPQPPKLSSAPSKSQTLSVRVEGRYTERLALLVAATIREPVMLVGSPGTGKTHLGRWCRSWYPGSPYIGSDRERERIWKSAGFEIVPKVPFLNPHARTHVAEFLGYQRSGQSYPGLFSLAHGGLMVLDEFPELARDVREIFRNVLDQRELRRFNGREFMIWPADFWLIATANPCACGLAAPLNVSRCRCGRGAMANYQSRFSGPLLDRFGIQLFMAPSREESPLENLVRAPALRGLRCLLDADPEALAETLQSARQRFLESRESGPIDSRKALNHQRIRAGLKAINIEDRHVDLFLAHFTRDIFDGRNFR